jgi:CII-binding regulator of phage lambda lysogenization HflD
MVTKSKKNMKNKGKKQNKLIRAMNSVLLTRKKLKKNGMKLKCRKCSICDKIKKMGKKVSLRKRDEVMMNNLYSNIVSPNNKMIRIVSSRCIKCDNNNPTGKMYCRNCDSM